MGENDEQNNNGGGEHPGGDLALASDILDWTEAGRRLLRCVDRLGHRVPPAGPGPANELAWRITEADEQLDRFITAWKTVIRPGLRKFENPPPLPPLSFL